MSHMEWEISQPNTTIGNNLTLPVRSHNHNPSYYNTSSS